MAMDYGYGELGDALLKLLSSGPPDFAAAEALIRQGADINADGNDEEENMLSEIMCDYWQEQDKDEERVDCSCRGNKAAGRSLCEIIRFFLAHGFDVTRRDGCVGAQCLYALTLSTFDRHMIEAIKLLLDAGARNRTITPTADSDETPWSFIGTEGSYQCTCKHDHALANIFEAAYQVYQAVEDGRPYSGIDSYEMSVGKRILSVWAESDGKQPVFYPIALERFEKENCYTSTLYFVYEGGVLVSTKYVDFWTDSALPDDRALVNVSERFEGMVGSVIERFIFGYKADRREASYGQSIAIIEMNSGRAVRFSGNRGEVPKEERAAYYEFL